jgi:hypothetical protein
VKTKLWLALLVFCCASVTVAQIPRTIGYQGILTDTLGNPKPDGRYTILFRFYDTPVGKLPIWEEQKTLMVSHGLFSTSLGDQVAFPSGVDFDQPYWLALGIDGGPELVPRIPLNAVGYSLNSRRADTAAYALSILPNSITGRDILDGSVGSGDIADVVRTLTFPAQSLNIAPGSNIIQRASGGFGGGLQWTFSGADAANLPMRRPADWDGTSAVQVTLWFTTLSAADGTVSFFIRPRTYSPGDTFQDITGTAGTPVTMAGAVQLYQQIITIAADRFGTKPYWHLVIQRDQTNGTYSGDVLVTSVEVSYVATR